MKQQLRNRAPQGSNGENRWSLLIRKVNGEANLARNSSKCKNHEDAIVVQAFGQLEFLKIWPRILQNSSPQPHVEPESIKNEAN
jgi:hypothetical protein